MFPAKLGHRVAITLSGPGYEASAPHRNLPRWTGIRLLFSSLHQAEALLDVLGCRHRNVQLLRDPCTGPLALRVVPDACLDLLGDDRALLAPRLWLGARLGTALESLLQGADQFLGAVKPEQRREFSKVVLTLGLELREFAAGGVQLLYDVHRSVLGAGFWLDQ